MTASIVPQIVFIVAAADNGAIGKDNALPWRVSSDLKRLKALTIGRPVIMGRKTNQSIGRPLPDRTNIVMTRDRGFSAAGIAVAYSPADALAVAMGDALRRGVDEIAVIGGAEIYALFLDKAARVELTRVHASPEGDAFFAPLDPAQWVEADSERHAAGPRDSADFSFVSYRRRAD